MEKFITMNGNYGCIPDNSEEFDTFEDAYSYLVELFDLEGTDSASTLKKTGYTDLPYFVAGADYCEIARTIV